MTGAALELARALLVVGAVLGVVAVWSAILVLAADRVDRSDRS